MITGIGKVLLPNELPTTGRLFASVDDFSIREFPDWMRCGDITVDEPGGVAISYRLVDRVFLAWMRRKLKSAQGKELDTTQSQRIVKGVECYLRLIQLTGMQPAPESHIPFGYSRPVPFEVGNKMPLWNTAYSKILYRKNSGEA